MTTTLLSELLARCTPDGDCLVWQGPWFRKGYGRCCRKYGDRYAHRAVYVLTHGSIEPSLVVRHTCDNPPCINPQHLVLGTYADNARDASLRGRLNTGRNHWTHRRPDLIPRGSSHHASRLSPEDIEAIRRAGAAGITQRKLAETFGVSPMTISRAIARQTYTVHRSTQ